MTEAIRQIYWNVGEHLGSFTVYMTATAALLVLFYGIVRDANTWRKGQPDARLDVIGSRVTTVLAETLGQQKTMVSAQDDSGVLPHIVAIHIVEQSAEVFVAHAK